MPENISWFDNSYLMTIFFCIQVFNIVCLISWSSRINYENSRQDSYGGGGSGGGVGYMDPNRQYGGSGYSQREMKSEDITYIHGTSYANVVIFHKIRFINNCVPRSHSKGRASGNF